MRLGIYVLSFRTSTFLKTLMSGGEWNIWLPFGALVNFCHVYLDQVHTCTGSLEVVGSVDRLEVRLLRWRPSLLVGSVVFGLWGLDDVLDDLLVICLLAWATSVVGVGVVGALRFSC
jgi:hypothetical protein